MCHSVALPVTVVVQNCYIVSQLLGMLKLVQNLCYFEGSGDLGNALRTSKGLLGAFLEAGAKSGVLKGAKSDNSESLFGASHTLASP